MWIPRANHCYHLGTAGITTVVNSSPSRSGIEASHEDSEEWVWELNPKKDPEKRWTMTHLGRQHRRQAREREELGNFYQPSHISRQDPTLGPLQGLAARAAAPDFSLDCSTPACSQVGV